MSWQFDGSAAPNRYYDPKFKMDAVKILPGEYFVTTRDMLIVTVLGSCVSVCLRDSAAGVAGMNHFMLPGGGEYASNPDSSCARYGSYAMEVLINHLLKLGATRSRLEAKVFGGGAVIQSMSSTQIGDFNVTFAMDFLRTERILVVASDVLDVYPRKIYFFARNGRVLVKKIKNLHNDTIFEREKAYEKRIETSVADGDVELFS